VAVWSTFIPHVAATALAEAMAMKDGLALANRMGCTRLQAELDSSETIDAV
jgi:hypothetical protein